MTAAARTRIRPRRTAKRKPWSALRKFYVVFLVVGGAGFLGVLYLFSRVPVPPEAVQAQTTFFTDTRGTRLASLDAGEDRVPVKLSAVPDVVISAVLAVEDRKFFEHRGLDPFAIVRATWADVRGRSARQGGSTITQQYVKSVYVGRERSLWRKMREAAVAVKLERQFSKAQILERYLNAIYLGRGAYGVQAASRAWFGKDVGELGLREAAFLAGLIRAPELADIDRNPAEALRRRDGALEAMKQSNAITAAEAVVESRVPVRAYVVARTSQEPSVVLSDKGTQYFVEYVRQQLVGKYGEAAVVGGGLRVKTTLDLSAQSAAFDAVQGVLNRPDDPSGALVAVDDDGAIRAMVGGRDWHTSKVNLAVGRDGGGHGRQAGSTFKAFLLAETVRQGYSVESALPAPGQIVIPKGDRGGPWRVANYDRQGYGSALNLIDATRNSVNTVYAQLVMAIGANEMAAMARDLGITSPLSPVNSLVLGTSDVSPLEMARAFATFANRGLRTDVFSIAEVRTADGRLLESARQRRTRVLDDDDADMVTFALRQAVERGTGAGARIGRPVAGKTGTTDDYRDAWFVGYTPQLTTAVWMGYPAGDGRLMTSVHGRRVTGGSFPADIFRRFMTTAMRGRQVLAFHDPVSFGGKPLGDIRIPWSLESTTTTASSTSSSIVAPTSSSVTTTTSPGSTTTQPGDQSTTTTVPRSTTTTEPGDRNPP